MQGKYLPRRLESEVTRCLAEYPAVAVLGPRQCGKSTLARHVLEGYPGSMYLDLERPSDARKLTEPELFFDLHRDRLICLDEIQRTPEIFPVLRGVMDDRGRNGQFLILGSASGDLLRQSSESLAGRIAYLELNPFVTGEAPGVDMSTVWLRGGFPLSLLAGDEAASMRWRRNFVRTFLERDIPRINSRISGDSIERLWRMCMHYHAQLLNLSALGASLGLSHHTVRAQIEILSKTFMLRVLSPCEANVKKRLVKSPRIYIRDSGILHALAGIHTREDLLGHPVFGASWEGFVVENILAVCPEWTPGFYRSATGAEMDLVLDRGRKRIAVECKASPSPEVSRGFFHAVEDLKPDEVWVAAPVRDVYPLGRDVRVAPLQAIMQHLSEIG